MHLRHCGMVGAANIEAAELYSILPGGRAVAQHSPAQPTFLVEYLKGIQMGQWPSVLARLEPNGYRLTKVILGFLSSTNI